MLTLFTDTGLDFTKETAKEFGYNLVAVPYIIDGKSYTTETSAEILSFYEKIKNGALPKTSSISEERFIEYFEPVLKNGDDVLYVHFSRKLSGMFNNMDRAISKLQQKYPERKIYTIDTKTVATSGLNIAKEISELYKSGKTAPEILSWAKENLDHFTEYFFIDNLKFLQRSGRVSNVSGTVGTLLGVRPLVFVDKTGEVKSISKEKGLKRAMLKIVEKMEELGSDLENHRTIIASSGSEEYIEELKSLVLEHFPSGLNIETAFVGPLIGTHCGPNATGVSFYAKNR